MMRLVSNLHRVPLCLLVLLWGCGDDDGSAADASTLDDAAIVDMGVDLGPDESEGFEPSGEVTIRRDDLGIPHIEGADAADAFYGAGYSQARDRLLQMSLIRLRAQGRRAEVLPDKIDDDILLRTVNIARMGRENAERARAEYPESHALIVAWTAGVNRFIGEVLAGEVPTPYGFDELGFEPERWRTEDAYTVGKLLLFSNANQLEFDLLASLIRRYAPEIWTAFDGQPWRPMVPSYVMPEDERPAVGMVGEPLPASLTREPLPDDAAERLRAFTRRMRELRPGASNNWAMDGRHTADGRPLIAGDPHQPLQSPSIFYAQHVKAADGSFNAAGFSFVGTPAVQLGHNEHVVWTATTTYPDWMDLVAVDVTADDTVMVGGESVPIARRSEYFEVAGDEPQVETFVDVPGHGVLLPRGFSPLPLTDGNRRVMVRWAGDTPTSEADAFHAVDTAESLEDFETAVDRMELGAFNFVAATGEGISYRSSPRVPDRGTPGTFGEPWAVLDGNDPSSGWTGDFLSLEQLPRSRAETTGWIASANNDNYGFTGDGALEGDAFYYGVWFDPGTRGYRIGGELERLAERGDVTPEDFRTLQQDTHSVVAELILPTLFEAADGLESDEALADYRDRDDLAGLVERLRAWDQRMDRPSADALVFQAWVYFFTERVLADELGILFEPLIDASSIYLLKWLRLALLFAPDVVDGPASAHAYGALDETATYLTETFGGLDASAYEWGDVHGAVFRTNVGGRYERDWVPTDGADGTVNVADASFLGPDGPVERMEVGGGAVYRMVASFDESGHPQAVINFIGGISGDPDSDFWDDRTEGWIEGDYEELAFEEAEIAERTVETTTLTP
jgi:penicillin amidase